MVRAETPRRGERRRAFASVSRQRDYETRGGREGIGRWRGRRHHERYTSASPRLCANQSSSSMVVAVLTPAFAGERLGAGRMRASPRPRLLYDAGVTASSDAARALNARSALPLNCVTDAIENERGLIGRLFLRTSNWRCGPVDSPVEPT